MSTDATAPPWVPEHPTVPGLAGAGVARAVLGRTVRIGAERGTVIDDVAGRSALVTTHPSALRGRGGHEEAFAAFVADLRTAAKAVDEPKEQRDVR